MNPVNDGRADVNGWISHEIIEDKIDEFAAVQKIIAGIINKKARSAAEQNINNDKKTA